MVEIFEGHVPKNVVQDTARYVAIEELGVTKECGAQPFVVLHNLRAGWQSYVVSVRLKQREAETVQSPEECGR
jgi:hypothetical protein